MSRRRSLSDEERALWTGVARSITPLDGRRASAAEPPAVPDIPEPLKPSPRAAGPRGQPSVKPPPAKQAPPLAPLERRLKKRVARGREPIDARLDLHGMTQSQAHAKLMHFLRRAQADGFTMVLVVTGKGTRRLSETSAGDAATERGVLRRQVPLWLALPEFRSLVIGFDDAHVGHGGEGALYVRLRRQK